MADTTKTVNIIFKGEDQVSATAKNIESSLQGVGTTSSGAAKDVEKVNDALKKTGDSSASIDKATQALKILAASLVFKAFLDANIEAEKFDRTLTLVTGSSAGAAEAFDYVRGVSNRLGVDTLATADAFAKFSAATKGSALEGENSRVIFEAFTATMSRVGSSSADIAGAFVQLSQGISKGRFELEDLKSIAERVPGFFTLFSESLGKTTAELFKMISAGQITGAEILKFANTLNENLDGAKFDGYAQNFARLKNAIDDAFITIGKSGVLDALTKSVQVGTAAVTGAVASFTLLGEVIGAVVGAISVGDFSGLGDALSASFDKAATKTRDARDALLGFNEEASKSGSTANKAGKEVQQAFSDARFETEQLERQTAKTDAALKALGLNPKKFDQDIEQIKSAFQTLLDDPAVSGDTILAGLKKTLGELKNESQINDVVASLSQRFTEGGLGANQYAQAIDLARKRIIEVGDVIPKTNAEIKQHADEIKKAEQAAKDAEKAAREWALEMEKIASNERIKIIEAKVTLNVANVESEAKKVVAAFDSISNTVSSTGDVLSTLFGLFENYSSLDWSAIRKIEEQIDGENKRRDAALDLQKRLTDAQIELLRAQKDALVKEDALIKIDGAGLQPHLEAFMWEILKTIQVRANRDGLAFLLGI